MRERVRGHERKLIAGAICLVLAACATLTTMKLAHTDRGIKFPHAKHKDAAGCTDCHAISGPDAAMPGHDVCSTCHDINTDKPDPKECGLCHTRSDYSVTPRKKILTDEIIFTHEPHVKDNKVECATCHADPDKSTLPNVPLMPWCMNCHAGTDPKLNECAVCHKEIRKDKVPTMRAGYRIAHDSPQIWQKTHGQEYRYDKAYCGLCHDNQVFCQDCHQKTPPADHTIAWRRKPHGLRAEWDRTRCAACHDEDSCVKCHSNTQPASHRGAWGFPANLHCINCHFPPQDNSCTVCHEEIQHVGALPSPHNLGVYPTPCAICHPGNNPFLAPHPTNSTTRCVFCHNL
jgi:hypothetical protein